MLSSPTLRLITTATVPHHVPVITSLRDDLITLHSPSVRVTLWGATAGMIDQRGLDSDGAIIERNAHDAFEHRQYLSTSPDKLAPRYDTTDAWCAIVMDTPRLLGAFLVDRLDPHDLPTSAEYVATIAAVYALRLASHEDIAMVTTQADTDPLTGLARRHVFDRTLALRRDSGDALVMIDLDGFKQVNDTHGHAAGDALLAKVGTALRAATRAADCVARVGGDEFAIILPAPYPSIPDLKQRLHAALASAGARGSIGIVPLISTNGRTAQELLAHADALMYEAKRQRKAILS